MRNIATALVLLLALLVASATAQDVINPQTNASALTTGTLAAARGGAGTITGALKGNGAGTVSQAACADLSNGAAGCSAGLPLSVANGGTGDTGTAWTTYTPGTTCNAGSGTWTTNTAHSKSIGKTVFIEFDLTLTTDTSCTGLIFNFSAPSVASSGAGLVGGEIALTGNPVICRMPATGSVITCVMTTGTLASGDRFVGSGVYESQ